MRGILVILSVPSACGDSPALSSDGRAGNNLRGRGNPQPTRPSHHSDGSLAVQRSPRCGSSRSVQLESEKGLRYGLLPSERMRQATGCTGRESGGSSGLALGFGSEELACGSQAFIATLLFDPSMSALPIIVKQNSPSVGLFTRQ